MSDLPTTKIDLAPWKPDGVKSLLFAEEHDSHPIYTRRGDLRNLPDLQAISRTYIILHVLSALNKHPDYKHKHLSQHLNVVWKQQVYVGSTIFFEATHREVDYAPIMRSRETLVLLKCAYPGQTELYTIGVITVTDMMRKEVKDATAGTKTN